MKKIFAEFKSFALRGNVIDLAVGVIIGAALSQGGDFVGGGCDYAPVVG